MPRRPCYPAAVVFVVQLATLGLCLVLTPTEPGATAALHTIDLPPDLKAPFASDGPAFVAATTPARSSWVAPDLDAEMASLPDIRDPFRHAPPTVRRGSVRITRASHDLLDPFRPSPAPCANDVVIDGVSLSVQRPDPLQRTRAVRCQAMGQPGGDTPDLRDPFTRHRR